MVFEFDPVKSQINKVKHGIDFHEAQFLWEAACVEFAAKSEYENRYALIGKHNTILYTCIYTLRGEKIRIISCRRAREQEKRLYETSFNP